MTDEELVAAFESGALEASAFTHAAHVRVAWWYLRTATFTDALARFSTALRGFAARHGASGKYHETITVASFAVIAARLHETPELDWESFAARHADLLVRQPSILERYYSSEILASDRARATFLLPDARDRESREIFGRFSAANPPATESPAATSPHG